MVGRVPHEFFAVLHGREPDGIVRGTVNDAAQAWRREGLDELSSAGPAATSPEDAAAPELWFADLADFMPWLTSGADLALLCADERQRAAGMSSPEVREHFLLSRLLLRRVLGARRFGAQGVHSGATPTDERLKFVLGKHGKPALLGGDASTIALPHFNLSHCRGAWLLGISRTAAIGVDIERPRRVDNALRLATRVFTAAERAALLAANELTVDERDAYFLRCWTRKEAVLKAMGSGFASPAADIEVSASMGPLSVSLPGAATVNARVASVSLPVAGFAAWALLGEGDFPVPHLRWLHP